MGLTNHPPAAFVFVSIEQHPAAILRLTREFAAAFGIRRFFDMRGIGHVLDDRVRQHQVERAVGEGGRQEIGRHEARLPGTRPALEPVPARGGASVSTGSMSDSSRSLARMNARSMTCFISRTLPGHE